MKNILIILGFLLSLGAYSQNSAKTETIAVKGNCEQCKKRIENAADIKGVKICNWDEKTQVATVTYNPEKVSLAQIEESIAKAGHDAGVAKASDKVYKNLPGCCQYRDRACNDKK